MLLVKDYSLPLIHYIYKNFVKNILFLHDAESIHESILSFGKLLGSSHLSNQLTETVVKYINTSLKQQFFGLTFESPIGLAAGFDYEAKLTQFLPSLGFGFETVGTITNMSYEGNPKPRLGRLPNSKSLMVNKGFKNAGAKTTVEKLENLTFKIPLGISIGRTNSPILQTQKESINDIVSAFNVFEKSQVKHSYYELNISCPNLIYSNISFYPPKNLKKLLTEINKLKIKRPVFIKMPIEKRDKETLQMLEIISKYSPKGVIFGNLQKDRANKFLDPREVKQFAVGNFSGKPTYERSNQLISLTYKHFKKRFLIIGCGGVFSASDAFEKITRGASLVQLITGLVFEGPQLISQINLGLVKILQKNGLKNVSEAIGIRYKQ